MRFNDLNGQSLREWFQQLQQKLERCEIQSPRQLGRVAYELQALLDELCVSNGLYERPEATALPPSTALASIESTIHWISAPYYQALEQLIAQRKFKNKLNLNEVKQYIEQHCMEMITLEQLRPDLFCQQGISEQGIQERV
ncbi:hypothetical protein P9222_08075 [Paenibacillus amylolyticus]|nr:hypothetical protein [Paenibacillus amylolyticus]WFR64132.1 hypothetical protein P9222_08075 [Paenibacillus amylolyticus]